MVAGNTAFLNPGEGSRVLEIGTGSGFMASVIQSLVGESGLVECYEIDRRINEYAKRMVSKNYGGIPANMGLKKGDGFRSKGEYDRIHISVFPVSSQSDVLYTLSDGGVAIMAQARYNETLLGPFDVFNAGKLQKEETSDGRELYRGGLILIERTGMEGGMDDFSFYVARHKGYVQPAKSL